MSRLPNLDEIERQPARREYGGPLQRGELYGSAKRKRDLAREATEFLKKAKECNQPQTAKR